MHGVGEASNSRNDALLKSTGRPYLIAHGEMPQGTDPNGVVRKFIVLCPQSPIGNATIGLNSNGITFRYIWDWLKANYRVDTTRRYFSKDFL
jgi:hypothetical protein